MDESTSAVLSELQRLQERAHLKDPVKAAMRKRYVCGLREVLRSLKTNKAKALVVAHNIERIEAEAGERRRRLERDALGHSARPVTALISRRVCVCASILSQASTT